MTVRQVIEEIKELPRREQEEVLAFLQGQVEPKKQDDGEVAYADHDRVMRVADRIFTERADLFKKLAQ